MAEANVGVQGAAEGELDAGLFTTGQVRTVFSVGLRMMELPVGSKADGSSSGGAGGGMSTGYNGIGMKVDFRGGNALFLKRKQVRVWVGLSWVGLLNDMRRGKSLDICQTTICDGSYLFILFKL